MSVNSKVSTGLFDAWGQEIFLGDLVVQTNSSHPISYDGTPYSVTKVGTKANVQLNCSSYTYAQNVLVVTGQYVKRFGVEKHQKLLKKFPYVAVKAGGVRSPVSTYDIIRVSSYSRVNSYPNLTSRKYFALEIVGNNKKEKHDNFMLICKDQLGIDLEQTGGGYIVQHLQVHRSNFMGNSRVVYSFRFQQQKISKTEYRKSISMDYDFDILHYLNKEITDTDILTILDKIP